MTKQQPQEQTGAAAGLTAAQASILDHTLHRTANGFFCGISPAMSELVAAGLMESAGRASFCPDEYFRITGAGRAALAAHRAAATEDRR